MTIFSKGMLLVILIFLTTYKINADCLKTIIPEYEFMEKEEEFITYYGEKGDPSIVISEDFSNFFGSNEIFDEKSQYYKNTINLDFQIEGHPYIKKYLHSFFERGDFENKIDNYFYLYYNPKFLAYFIFGKEINEISSDKIIAKIKKCEEDIKR